MKLIKGKIQLSADSARSAERGLSHKINKLSARDSKKYELLRMREVLLGAIRAIESCERFTVEGE